MSALSIGEWIALVASFVAILVSLFKTKPEIRALSGDSAESYSEAAKNYAEQVVKLQERLTKAEESLATVMGEINELRKENGDLRDWAERLTHQVKSLGAVPVAMRVKAEPK